MTLKHTMLLLASFALVVLTACGSPQPPKELLDARAAYAQAQKSKASELAPAQLHEAKEALDKAEAAFENEPKTEETRDLAYVAQRRAQWAEANGDLQASSARKTQAGKDLQSTQSQNLSATRNELARTKQELEKEKVARAEAEKKAKEAMDNLAKIAAVKHESRGVVITLSGSVLFASAKWALLPGAQSKLDEVAVALKGQPDRNILIEGHTDSQGKAASNDELSLKRANSVRDYLVSRGIPSDRIRGVGIGSARPVADNSTAEGRANNRRVEIIVEEPR